MARTKLKPLILEEAQENTKDSRRYILKSFGAGGCQRSCRVTSSKLL